MHSSKVQAPGPDEASRQNGEGTLTSSATTLPQHRDEEARWTEASEATLTNQSSELTGKPRCRSRSAKPYKKGRQIIGCNRHPSMSTETRSSREAGPKPALLHADSPGGRVLNCQIESFQAFSGQDSGLSNTASRHAEVVCTHVCSTTGATGRDPQNRCMQTGAVSQPCFAGHACQSPGWRPSTKATGLVASGRQQRSNSTNLTNINRSCRLSRSASKGISGCGMRF